MTNRFGRTALALSLGALLFAPTALQAETATGEMKVKIEIVKSCTVKSASELDFGSTGVITDNVDANATITVLCSALTPFKIGLGAGQGQGASTTTNTRMMTGPGSATVGYKLFQDAQRETPWGDTTTGQVDVVSATATGQDQPFVVYGRVPPQDTPAPGTYNDTVAITITY